MKLKVCTLVNFLWVMWPLDAVESRPKPCEKHLLQTHGMPVQFSSQFLWSKSTAQLPGLLSLLCSAFGIWRARRFALHYHVTMCQTDDSSCWVG